MIISVGYRVNSIRGVRFRQWANSVLKQYLIKGYAVNERIRKQQISELRQLVQVLGRTLQQQPLPTTDESNALFKVVVDYTYALDTLDDYDYQRLSISKTTSKETFHATYENAMKEINVLKKKFGYSPLFGNEKDDSFKSSIGQIYQTFGGVDLYPSVEEKAAMLLYLVTKNHSFSDGNKRIAATLFLWFMNNNGILYREDGTKRIADSTLVALTLMIAESRTQEKDVMVKVVVNLINKTMDNMGTALLAMCFCAVSLLLALFVSLSPISEKAKIRILYAGAVVSFIAVPLMDRYIAGLNNFPAEMRYRGVLVFVNAVCCFCFIMAFMIKYQAVKKKVDTLEQTVEQLEHERATAMVQSVNEDKLQKVEESLEWFAKRISVLPKRSRMPSTPAP